MLRLRTSLPVVALLCLGLVLPASSAAAPRDVVLTPSFGFQRWPGTAIPYWDASRDKVAVARAVAAWNRSGLRIRFVKARSARAARLIIRNTRDVPNGCGSGMATRGYVAPPGKAYLNLLANPAPTTQACAWPGKTLLVAHELGHVLGLGHVQRGCRIMNSTIVEGMAPSGCVTDNSEDAYIARKATWRCRILEPADVRAAVRLYGGVVRPVRVNPTCNVVAPIPAPTISAAWDAEQRQVRLSIRRPAAPAIPAFLQSRADRTERFELHRSRDTCVAAHVTREDPYAATLLPPWTWTAAAGADQAELDPGAAPGTWCWSVWAVDAFGRHGAGPGTATLVVPEDPPAA